MGTSQYLGSKLLVLKNKPMRGKRIFVAQEQIVGFLAVPFHESVQPLNRMGSLLVFRLKFFGNRCHRQRCAETRQD